MTVDAREGRKLQTSRKEPSGATDSDHIAQDLAAVHAKDQCEQAQLPEESGSVDCAALSEELDAMSGDSATATLGVGEQEAFSAHGGISIMVQSKELPQDSVQAEETVGTQRPGAAQKDDTTQHLHVLHGHEHVHAAKIPGKDQDVRDSRAWGWVGCADASTGRQSQSQELWLIEQEARRIFMRIKELTGNQKVCRQPHGCACHQRLSGLLRTKT